MAVVKMVGCKWLISTLTNISEKSSTNATNTDSWKELVSSSDSMSTKIANLTRYEISADWRQRIQACGEKNEDQPASFIITNERMLVAIILGVVLIFLILTTLKFSLKMFARYYEDRNEETEMTIVYNYNLYTLTQKITHTFSLWYFHVKREICR